ncbi:BfpM-like protein [Escherichia coli]|nr:BfpM-like protein [Escherichia coli]
MYQMEKITTGVSYTTSAVGTGYWFLQLLDRVSPSQWAAIGVLGSLNRPGFPGECFICELRLPDHRFRWKHNKLFLLLPEEYGPAFPAIVDCYTSPPT